MIKLFVIAGTDSDYMLKKTMGNGGRFIDGDIDYIKWPEIKKFEIGKFPCALTQKDQFDCGFNIAIKATTSEYSQIVITHSDHIFNGIRVAIKQGKISHEEVEFRFYQPNQKVQILKCDKDGRFEVWPAGFFTQLDLELSQLI